MAQSRNQKKTDRMQSAVSITAGGGVAVTDNPNDYPTQTLFEQIKDKQVYYI